VYFIKNGKILQYISHDVWGGLAPLLLKLVTMRK